MDKVTGHTNLYRRGATYYFRARVPKDIMDTYGKDEERFSLKTKDKTEAVQAVRLKSAEVELKFEPIGFASGDLSAFTGRAIWYLNHFFHANANENTKKVIAVAREMQHAHVRALESLGGV